MYDTKNDIRFKSSLCDYSEGYMLVKGTIAMTGARNDDAARRADEGNRGVIFKNCVPFINCKIEINNTEIDNAKDIDIAIPNYNLIEYSDNYSKTSGGLWQYCKDGPNDNLPDSESFKSKLKIKRNTLAGGNTKMLK